MGMLGNLLFNLAAPAPTGNPFQGGYQPAQPGNPATPQDFTNYSGPPIDPGSPQIDPKAASFQPYTVDPALANSLGAKLRGLASQWQEQAAQMNQQAALQQMQAQNNAALQNNVFPTDPTLGQLFNPTMQRAQAQIQAGTLGGQANSLQSILSGRTTAAQIPLADMLGQALGQNNIYQNVAQGLNAQNAGIKAATIQPSVGSSALLQNDAEDNQNRFLSQNFLNRLNQATGAANGQGLLGQEEVLAGVRQARATQAGADADIARANSTARAYSNMPDFVQEQLKEQQQLSEAQRAALGYHVLPYGGASLIHAGPTGVDNAWTQQPGIQNMPKVDSNGNVVIDPKTGQPVQVPMPFSKSIPTLQQQSFRPQTIPDPYLNDTNSSGGRPPQMSNFPNIGQSHGVGGAAIAPSAQIPTNSSLYPQQIQAKQQKDIMDQVLNMTPAQRQRFIEQMQAQKIEGVAPMNSLLFDPNNSFMFQRR